MVLKCDWCGKEYETYQCGKNFHFCSIECRRKGGKLVASGFTAETLQKTQDRIIYYNKNVFNHGEYRERQANALRGTGSGSCYIKDHGKHQHRRVAEKMLGRPLRSDEIVHHKDGNKRNNNPENLEVMTQSEHIREHLRRGGGKLANSISTSKNSALVSENK